MLSLVNDCRQSKKQSLLNNASAEKSTSSVDIVRSGATTRSRSRHASFVRIHKGSPAKLNARETQTFKTPSFATVERKVLVTKKHPSPAKNFTPLQKSSSLCEEKEVSSNYIMDSASISKSKMILPSDQVAPVIKSEPPELVPSPPVLRRVEGHATKFNTYDASIHSEEKLVLSSLANLTTDQVLAQQSPSLFLLRSPLSLIKQRQLEECKAIQQTFSSLRLDRQTKTTSQTDTDNDTSTTVASILHPHENNNNLGSAFCPESLFFHRLDFWSPQPASTINKKESNPCTSSVKVGNNAPDTNSFNDCAVPKELFPASMLTGQVIQTTRGVAVLLLPQCLQERAAIARLAQCGTINDSSSCQEQPLDTRNKRWTASEDQLLAHAVQQFQGVHKWKEIAQTYFPGTRSANQCKIRWNKRVDPNIDRTPFTLEEDQTIIALRTNGKSWPEIASALGGNRRSDQVKNRFVNVLDPNRRKSAPWSDEEDRILRTAQMQLGNKWSIIAKRLPGRSDNDVKNHWYNMKHKQMRNMMKQRNAKRRQARLTQIRRQTQSNSVSSLDCNGGVVTATQSNPV